MIDTFLRLFRHAVQALDVTVVRDARLFGSTSCLTIAVGSPSGLRDKSVSKESLSNRGVSGLGDGGGVDMEGVSIWSGGCPWLASSRMVEYKSQSVSQSVSQKEGGKKITDE